MKLENTFQDLRDEIIVVGECCNCGRKYRVVYKVEYKYMYIA